MTETETPQTPEAVTPTPSPTPQISAEDINKIIEAKVSERVGDVSKQIKDSEAKAYERVKGQLVASLSGEKKDEKNPYHQAFLQEPEKLFGNVIEAATDSVLRTVNEREEASREISSAIAEVYGEYPDLQKIPNEVYAEYDKITKSKAHSDKPLADRLKMAAEKVASRVGAKKKSEVDKEAEINASAMTPTGAYMQKVSKGVEDSAKAFFKGRTEAMATINKRFQTTKKSA